MIEYDIIFEDDLKDYDFDPWMDAVLNGINILSNMKFNCALVDGNGDLIGALFTDGDQSSYHFDVFVNDKYRGQRFAGKLVDFALSEYRDLRSEVFHKLRIEAHVVSDSMKKILLKKGFYVKSGDGRSGWIMTVPVRTRIKKNPPSEGYLYIGRGYFSEAYTSVHDNTVELITGRKSAYLVPDPGKLIPKPSISDIVKDDKYRFYVYDMSKEAMIYARDQISKMYSGKFDKFLPEVKRKRIDFDIHGNVEFIYEMPFYHDWDCNASGGYTRASDSQKAVIEKYLEYGISHIYSKSRYSKKIVESDDFARFDGELGAYTNNIGIKDNVIVYRDPIVAQFLASDAVKLFAPLFPNYEDVKDRLTKRVNRNPSTIAVFSNPPSKGFRQLGSGVFAQAYVNNEENKEVELIIRAKDINTDNGLATYDLSRELLINLRDGVPAEFRKYLPDIKRYKIEFSDKINRIGDISCRLPEIIYRMPLYEDIRGNNKKIVSNIIRYIDSDLTSSTEYMSDDLILVSKCIVYVANKYKAVIDVPEENFSQTKDGTIIFRDVLIFTSDGFDGIRISDSWPKKYSNIFSKMIVAGSGGMFGNLFNKRELIDRGKISEPEFYKHKFMWSK